MIVCIVENSTEWDDWGQHYLLDTSKLTNSELRELLETNSYVEVYRDSGWGGVYELYNYHWGDPYLSDIEQAVIQPPQLVEKLVNITFE